jgi:basic membrane protein A
MIVIPLLSACAQQPADCAREEVFCVGMVTAYGSIEDDSLNQVVWEILHTMESQAQITHLDKIESINARDWEKNIIFFANHGYDVITTVGTNLGEATVAVATGYPGISFIGIDQELDENYENIATISFPQDQAGFLAGMLAAMVSTSGTVGAICETSGIEVVWHYCEGFRAGAIYERDDIEVFIVYRDSGERDKTFNDPEWGQQQMLSMINEGVDTMTAFGGNTAQGAFLAAAEKDVLVIGSEEDLYYRLPGLQSQLLTSFIKDPSGRLSSLMLLASQGKPIFGPYTSEINYAPFRMPQFETDMELKLNLEVALQGIRNGEIEINLPEKK